MSERPQNVAECVIHNSRHSARVSLWEEFVDDLCHRPTEIDESCKCLRVFLLAVLVLWLFYGWINLVCLLSFAKMLQKLAGNWEKTQVTPLACAFSAYTMLLCYSATNYQD